MSPRRADTFARAVYAADPHGPARRANWRKRAILLAASVAIVVLASVASDLPTHASLASQRAAASALLREVDADVSPCAYSLGEASTIYREAHSGGLAAADRARVPSLLQDDADACSFTSDNVNDLADIEEPGTGAGKYLAQVVALAQTWTTSDALGAIEDLTNLFEDPHDHSAAHDLAVRRAYLSSDRADAEGALRQAGAYLRGGLPSLALPAERLPA